MSRRKFTREFNLSAVKLVNEMDSDPFTDLPLMNSHRQSRWINYDLASNPGFLPPPPPFFRK
jgi:hypothetical protein